MKKKFFTLATVATLVASMTLSSCIGSFSLTNKLLDWNRNIDNKFVNEVVFFAFWILPVYEVAAAADVLVLNSIEFWTGDTPLAENSTKVIEGNDGKYIVEQDETGYTITSENDGSVVRFNYDKEDQSWSVVGTSGQEYKLMTIVDDNHMKVNIGNGEMMIIERNQAGLMAYRDAINAQLALMANK